MLPQSSKTFINRTFFCEKSLLQYKAIGFKIYTNIHLNNLENNKQLTGINTMLKSIKIWLTITALAALCLLAYSFRYNNGLISFLLSHNSDKAETVEHGNFLKVGVRDDITNFSYYNPVTGKYHGLEVEIADELAARMGYDGASLISVAPARRVEMLNSGTVDVIIGLYSVTEERNKEVDFSPIYYTDSVQLIAERTAGFSELGDLMDKTVAIIRGGSAEEELADAFIDDGIINRNSELNLYLKINKMESYKSMFSALEIGNIDALVADGAIALNYMNDDRVVIRTIGSASYAAATKKDSELSDKVASAMQDMLDDSTISRIEKNWGL